MARARNIKPGFFKNEYLPDVSHQGRLLFIGLWLLADREGRLEYRPRRIKGELFPYEECDVDGIVCQLASLNFVKKYEISGTQYLQILNFVRHQKPHPNEKASELPAPDDGVSAREKEESDRASSLNAECGMRNEELLGTSSQSAADAESGKPKRSAKPKPKTQSSGYPPEFEQAWAAYPPRDGGNPKRDAYKAWNARRKEGATPSAMLIGTRRYRAHCEAHGKLNTPYVMQGARFFGPSECYAEPYSTDPPSDTSKPSERRASATDHVMTGFD